MFYKTGYVATSFYSHGGGVNYLCLPKDPEWPRGATRGCQSEAPLYGTEYEWKNSPVMPQNRHNQDVPCSVCEVTGRGQKLMIPGKQSCPSGWTREYHGILMSQRKTYGGADYVCVDWAMQTIHGGHANTDGGLLYVVEAICGTLPCPPYEDGYEMSCVVCTK